MHPKTAEAGCSAPPTPQGTIFIGSLGPATGADVVQYVLRWSGLDVAAYRAAWQRAVTRRGATVDFTVRTGAVTDFLDEDRSRGFAVDAPPLVRVTVLTHPAPTVVITWHSAILDDRSLALLMAELANGGTSQSEFALTVAETVALQQLAERENVTLDAVLFAAWALAHGTDDAVFRVARRGSVLTSAPLRVRLDRSLSVGEWLRVIHHDHLLSDQRETELPRASHTLTVHAVTEPTLRVTVIHDRTADALSGRLHTALLRLADGSHGQVGDLSPGPLAHPRHRTIPDLFDEQVRRAPHADAVFDDEKWLSYAELDDRANRIAAALREHGVGVEEPVAVALPRGVDLIAAFLGVLKAGAAYLPVDAAHPQARNAMVFADSGARVVIADGGDWPADVVSVEDLPAAASAPCPARADTLAYLSYTSGSTGRPKGVAVPHRGVVRLVHEPNFATVGPGQTFLFAASPAFDATTFELWGALLTGARVVPAPPGPLDPANLGKLVDRHGVTLLWLTAGLFHQFVEHDVTVLSDVDQLLAGGDALTPDAVRAALAARRGKPVPNGYSPTENTTFTSCHVMRDADDVGATTPIGTPVQHTTVHVLDHDLRPVPAGEIGELYTGGEGVARGYLRRPALTAEKFVPDPFGPPGARLYRTGDRARWRADGTLEFHGRLDNQVKVRGFLVEPGETESVLRAHPGVVDAAVVVHGAGDVRGLVAYVTPADLDLVSVRAHVAAALPEFLRPSSYQPLPRLPLTANGKVDRAALPEPVASTGSGHRTLTGDAQHRMAEIWRALLGVDEVGAEDEFFELGGNSLLATRLTFRLRETFGVELPIREVYRASTLADLTDAVTSAATPATTGITRRDRRAYRTANAPHRTPSPAEEPDRHWAVTPRALSTPDVLPWVTPRLLPRTGNGGDVPRSPVEAAVLDAVDGVRTAEDIAAALSRTSPNESPIGTVGGPPDFHATDDGGAGLVAAGARSDEWTVRSGGAAPVSVTEVCRTLRALRDDGWVEVTASSPPELVASLLPPLSLLLESARWFASTGVALRRRALRDGDGGRADDVISRVDARLTAALQQRWADLLLPAPGQSRVCVPAASLRDKVSAAFAVTRPWPGAGQHTVDVLVAARAGEFQCVLDELHVGGTADAAEQPAGQLLAPFRPLPAAAHTPRVTIDDLVISPETWRWPTTELGFAFAADDATRFSRAQQWRQATGVPRFLAVAQNHVDLDSPLSVERFAHAVRAHDQETPGGPMTVREMVPHHDELYRADATGARYTAEIRFVAVDRRGPAPEGQS